MSIIACRITAARIDPSFSLIKPKVKPKIKVHNAHGHVEGTVTIACDNPKIADASIYPQPNLTFPNKKDLPKYLFIADCKYPLKNNSSPKPTINA